MKPDQILDQSRPWAFPKRPWSLRMNWHDLLFAHWPIPVDQLELQVPPGLEIDTYNGQAWLGIVPFGMQGVQPRFFPKLPWISAFPELNVRTYVTKDSRPGVWFFSLDAGNPVVVRTARATFHLPYFDAQMCLKKNKESVVYTSFRTHRGAPPAAFQAAYRPIEPGRRAEPGSLEEWLTARYCLYAADRKGALFRGEIHHEPWTLQLAEASIEKNTLTAMLGISLPKMQPQLHYSRSLDVLAWTLDPLT